MAPGNYRRGLAIGFGIIFSLLLLEGAARVYEGFHRVENYCISFIAPVAGPCRYGLTPGWYPREGLTILPDGHRGPARATDSQPVALTLAFFGNSQVFGAGLCDTATIAAQLERRLAARGLAAACENWGVPSYTSRQILFRLEQRLAAPDTPDYAFIGAGLNDLSLAIQLGEAYDSAATWLEVRFGESVLQKREGLYRFALARIGARFLRPREISWQTRRPEAVVDRVWPVMTANLRTAVRRCREAGVAPVVIVYDFRAHYTQPDDPWAAAVDGINRRLAELGREEHFAVVDLSAAVAGRSAPERYYGDAVHFSPAGAELAAESLERWLAANPRAPGRRSPRGRRRPGP